MSSTLQIPKFSQFCGKAFVAQKTTTKCCSHTCGSRAYKKRKREEKVQFTLSEQILINKSKVSKNLQALSTNISTSPSNYNFHFHCLLFILIVFNIFIVATVLNPKCSREESDVVAILLEIL